METSEIIRSIFEIALFAFIFWSIFNEEKYISFEKWLFPKIKSNLKRLKEYWL